MDSSGNDLTGVLEGEAPAEPLGLDEERWTVTQVTGALRERVRGLVMAEADERVRI